MEKLKKFFLMIGVPVSCICAILCSFAFSIPSLNELSEKKQFDSYYSRTNIDFIIPSPSRSQVSELEGSNGIECITPYYLTSSTVKVAGKNIETNILFFDDAAKANNTPYGTNRILKGDKTINDGYIVVDQSFCNTNKCSIGDPVEISLFDTSFTLVINSISEPNLHFENGSMAIFLPITLKDQFIENEYKYSGAYVKADNKEQAKEYFLNDYLPYGRLKERSSFNSEEEYLTHVENFEGADWSKEITVFSDNYNALSDKYSAVNKNTLINALITAIISLIVIIGISIYSLNNKDFYNDIRIYVRKTRKLSAVKSCYKNGIVFCFLGFSLFYLVTLILFTHNKAVLFEALGLLILGSPVITSLVSMLISNGMIESKIDKLYTPVLKENNKKPVE